MRRCSGQHISLSVPPPRGWDSFVILNFGYRPSLKKVTESLSCFLFTDVVSEDTRGEAPDKKVLLMIISSSKEAEQSRYTDSAEGEKEALLLLPGSEPPAHNSGMQ